MNNYKGISADDKHRIVAALKARGAGSCPRCRDSQWTVSEYSRIEVQATMDRDTPERTTIPAVMIVCEHCGFIAQHALQPLGIWDPTRTAAGERGNSADDGVRVTINQAKQMKKNLRERLFGARESADPDATKQKKEKTLAMINDADPGAKPRVRRTVGLTEQRLRAANQESWMTSTRGWSDFFGRFTRSSKR